MELMEIVSKFQSQGYDVILEDVSGDTATVTLVKDGIEETRQVAL